MSGQKGPVDRQSVRDSLNILEQVSDLVDSDDNYLNAILAQLTMMNQNGQAMQGGQLGIKPGMIGVAAESIDKNEEGDAVFHRDGTRFSVKVSPMNSKIERQDYVKVVSGNQVVEGPSSLPSANRDFSGGTQEGDNVVFVDGQAIEIPRVVRPGESLLIGNQEYKSGNISDVSDSLNAGAEKTFASIEVGSNQIILARAINQSQHADVTYKIETDGEEDGALTGGSPLAAPPDFYEFNPGGYYIAEDSIKSVIQEDTGNTNLTGVESTIKAIVVDK